jgi:hypothetical protein
MQLFQAFTKVILLIGLSTWLSACGGGSTTPAPWSTAELIESDVGNAFGPQIMSSPAYL